MANGSLNEKNMKSFQYFFFITFESNRIVLLIHFRENEIQDLHKDFISKTNFPKGIKFY